MSDTAMPSATAAASAQMGGGKAAAAATSPAAGAAELGSSVEKKSAKTQADVRLLERMSPAARKVLEKRQQNQAAAAPSKGAASPTDTGAAAQAAALPPQKGKAQVAAAAATTPAKGQTAADGAKPGDETKSGEGPDAGIIDFKELGKDNKSGDTTTGGDTEDGELVELTEAEANDLKTVRNKLTEAHKDNAKLRKAKREAAEALTQLQKDHETLKGELAKGGAQKPAAAGGRYLDSLKTVEEVKLAHADAREALKQLQEDPERELVMLSGNRPWRMVNERGESQTAKAHGLILEILDTYDSRISEITKRGDAEKAVNEKLPHLSKLVPDFEKRYQATLSKDWHSEGPEMAMNAALGELVASGEYLLVKRSQADKQKPAAAGNATVEGPGKQAATELPNASPPVRSVEAGKVDVAPLEQKARKGDKKALRQWIAMSGKQ